MATEQPREKVIIRPLGRPGDLGWAVLAHGEVYAQEYGWDIEFEALVARIVADYAGDHDPAREAAWIAEAGGNRVGCVFCVAQDESTAQLRILLVHPSARGLGAGTVLVRTCMEFARQAGYARMRLWTNDILADARRVYLAHGFRLIDSQPHHSYGADLVGQTYQADLTAAPGDQAQGDGPADDQDGPAGGAETR
jgi:GNAT superfamily N-acetyltransferase